MTNESEFKEEMAGQLAEELEPTTPVEQPKEAEPTVITVDSPEKDKTDIPNSEITRAEIEKIREQEISDEAFDYMRKLAAESEIDWDKVEFDPEDKEKLFPLITENDIQVFGAASDGILDADIIENYVRMARFEIQEYIDFKKQIEEDRLSEEGSDPDEEKYLENLEKTKDSARIILAIVQQHGRSLDKEFKDSKIAEDVIRVTTLTGLRDFIVSKYKLSTTFNKDQIKHKNTAREIEEDILLTMYVTSLYKRIIERDRIKADNIPKYNFFGPKFSDFHITDLSNAIRTYLTHGKIPITQDNIGRTMAQDFKILECFRSIVFFACKLMSTRKCFTDIKIEEEQMAKFAEILNPDEVFNDKMMVISSTVNKLFDLLMDPIVRQRIKFICIQDIKNDKLLSSSGLTEENLLEPDPEDYNMVLKVADLYPKDINEETYSTWRRAFVFMKKFQNLLDIEKLNKTSPENMETEVFHYITARIDDYSRYIYGELLTNLSQFFKENSNGNKETTDIMFSMVLSSLICQHDLGYRTVFDMATQREGPEVITLAKTVFKNKFDYLVGEGNQDLLLGRVDLLKTRQQYITNALEVVSFICTSLEEIRDNEQLLTVFNTPDPVFTGFKHKKSKKGKKHHR